MTRKSHLHPSDLHGFSRLTFDAVGGLTDVGEAGHHNISSTPAGLGRAKPGPKAGIEGLVVVMVR